MTATTIIYLILLGLVIGSFLNVVIYRLPIILAIKHPSDFSHHPGESQDPKPTNNKFNLAYPSSHCPNCKKPIKPYHNIPIISYLLLKGKCAYCKKPIAIHYPLVELLTAILTIIVILHFGLNLLGVTSLIFGYSLIVMSFIDIHHQILPDELTLSMLWLGLLLNSFNLYTTSRAAILGAAAGYLFLLVVAKLFKLIRKLDGIGHGDLKLLAMLGAWLGWQQFPFIILFSSLTGSVISLILILFNKHKFSQPLPFGPYIAVAGFIAMLWGDSLLRYYMHIIGA